MSVDVVQNNFILQTVEPSAKPANLEGRTVVDATEEVKAIIADKKRFADSAHSRATLGFVLLVAAAIAVLVTVPIALTLPLTLVLPVMLFGPLLGVVAGAIFLPNLQAREDACRDIRLLSQTPERKMQRYKEELALESNRVQQRQAELANLCGEEQLNGYRQKLDADYQMALQEIRQAGTPSCWKYLLS